MTPTPERALELADKLEPPELCLQGVSVVSSAEMQELVGIARRYAEIATHWKAVLDAEPVAEISADGRLMLSDAWTYGDKLIIKPTP